MNENFRCSGKTFMYCFPLRFLFGKKQIHEILLTFAGDFCRA